MSNQPISLDDSLEEIFRQLIPVPYPHQNMGLLPDEMSNLDRTRVDINRNTEEEIDKAKQSLRRLMVQECLSELKVLITHINAFEEYQSEPNEELKNVNRVILGRIAELEQEVA